MKVRTLIMYINQFHFGTQIVYIAMFTVVAVLIHVL